MSLVSLVRTDAPSNFKISIEKAIELINFRFDPNIRKIVIKPNMCYYWDYSTGETTDPKFVGGLIDFLRDNTSSDVGISIVESDASAMKCAYAFKILGYEKLAKEKEVALINLSDDENERTKVKVRDSYYTFQVPQTLRNADMLINVPKIKHMVNLKLTCALKNMYGCNPYPQKFRYHHHLDEVIVGLNKVMESSICLVDGVVVRGSCTKKLGLLMASKDPVATDSVAARLLGLEPRKIDYLVLAEKEGLGEINYKSVGENIQYFEQRFPREKPVDKIKSLFVRGLSALGKIH